MLNIFRFFRRKAAGSTRIASTSGIPMDRYENKLDSYEKYLEAGTSKLHASWGAIRLCADKVASISRKLVKDGKPVDKPDAQLDALLKKPNPFTTMSDLLFDTVCCLKICGNAYWLLDELTMAGTKPMAIYSLNPSQVKIVVDATKGITGYQYRAGGKTVTYTPEQIIHFKFPHPNDQFNGLGDYEAASMMLSNQLNRLDCQSAFWRNGAAPAGILISDQEYAGQEEWDKEKDKIDAEVNGVRRAGKILKLNGKWSYTQIGLSGTEIQSIEGEQFNIEQIYLLHGVPLSVAGIRDAANYATAEIEKQLWGENTIWPLVSKIEETLNDRVIVGYGDGLALLFDKSWLINVGRMVEILAPLFDRGAMTPNELRERLGMSKVDNSPMHDMFYISGGLVPLDLSGSDNTGVTAAAAQATVQRFIDSTFTRKTDAQTKPTGRQ